MQVIYADVLMAVNLSMDFLTLYLTGRLMRRPLRPGRLLTASVIGGIYGVAALFLEGFPLVSVPIHALVTLLICYVAYGRPILGVTAVFYGIGFLLGGGMTALWTAVNRWRGDGGGTMGGGTPGGAGRLSPGWFAILALLCAAGAMLVGGVTRRRQMAPEAMLRLGWEDRRWRGRGIVDSANFLTEPISGTPVILLPWQIGKSLFPPALYEVMASGKTSDLLHLPPELAKKVRLVPMVSAGGGRIVAAVKPDRCEVDGMDRTAFVGLGDVPRAMIPADLTKG